MQGWGEDPFGLHEQRYFSAGRPTKLVRDGHVESYDEPPSGTPQRAGAVAEAGMSGRGAWVSGSFAAEAPGRADVIGNAPGYEPARPGTSRVRMVTVVVLAVAAVATLVVVVNWSGFTRVPAISPAALVARSAQRTLAEGTAGITLSETIQAEGHSSPLILTGVVDLGTGAMEISGAYNNPGRPVAMKEIAVGGNVYVAMTVDGKSLVTRGRHWMVVPLPRGPRADPAYGDLFSSLSVLRHPGSAVRILGAKTIGGRRCTGYAVTPGRQAIAAEASATSGTTGLFPAKLTAPPTYTIWADAKGLIREFGTNMHWSAQALPPGTMSVALVVYITRYGSPVHITAPAASDTYSNGELRSSAARMSAGNRDRKIGSSASGAPRNAAAPGWPALLALR